MRGDINKVRNVNKQINIKEPQKKQAMKENRKHF